MEFLLTLDKVILCQLGLVKLQWTVWIWTLPLKFSLKGFPIEEKAPQDFEPGHGAGGTAAASASVIFV